MKHFLNLKDMGKKNAELAFDVAEEIKTRLKRGVCFQPLAGMALAMIFEKPSLRTRVTFETGMTQLGGHAISLTREDINLGVRESISDAAKNLERIVDGIMIRTFAHKRVTDLAKASGIPVINGLTDLLHPCQVLADCFTIREKLGGLGGVKIAYVGDGNNMTNSWLNASLLFGFNLVVGCPEGYEPDKRISARAIKKARGSISFTNDPREAVSKADVVYTDTWASMGMEDEAEERETVFKSFQVNKSLMRRARKNALFMHCLPAHRGSEVTDEVIDSPNSIVFDEAENRLHVQKAIMVMLMSPSESRGVATRRDN
ncbi:ornithine carbamoyltransferase [Candidatus Hydrogenedentota bacterium]